MNNEDIRLRRVKILVRDLNKELAKACDQGVAVNLDLKDKTKTSDKQTRYVLELKNADK